MPDISSVKFPELVGAIHPTKPTRKPNKPGEKRRSVKWHGLSLGRQPTPWEAKVLSLHDMVDTFSREHELAVTTLTSWRSSQLTRALSLSRVELLPDDETAAILGVSVKRMARYGAYEVRRELRRQGAVIPEPKVDVLDQEIDALVMADHILAWSVNLSADRLRTEWRHDIQRATIRMQRTKRLKNFQEHWSAAITACIPYGVKGATKKLHHEAFNAGRRLEAHRLSMLFNLHVVKRGGRWCVVTHDYAKTLGCHDTQQEADTHLEAIEIHKHSATVDLKGTTIDDDEAERLVDYVIQTAVMDNATCQPCEDVDGEIYDYDDDDQQQNEPPYYLCLGGDNCRCVQVYVLKDGGAWVVREDQIIDQR